MAKAVLTGRTGFTNSAEPVIEGVAAGACSFSSSDNYMLVLTKNINGVVTNLQIDMTADEVLRVMATWMNGIAKRGGYEKPIPKADANT